MCESKVVTAEDGVSAPKRGRRPKDTEFVDIAPYVAWLHRDNIDIARAVKTAVTELPILTKFVNRWGGAKVGKEGFWGPNHVIEEADEDEASRSLAFQICARTHYNFPGHGSKGSRSIVWGVYVFAIMEAAYFKGWTSREDISGTTQWLQLVEIIEYVLSMYGMPTLDEGTDEQIKQSRKWSPVLGKPDTVKDKKLEGPTAFSMYKGGLEELRWQLVHNARTKREGAKLTLLFKNLLSSSSAAAVNPVTGHVVPGSVSMPVVRTLSAAYRVRSSSVSKFDVSRFQRSTRPLVGDVRKHRASAQLRVRGSHTCTTHPAGVQGHQRQQGAGLEVLRSCDRVAGRPDQCSHRGLSRRAGHGPERRLRHRGALFLQDQRV